MDPTTPPRSEERRSSAGALEGDEAGARLGTDDVAGMIMAGKPDDEGLDGSTSGSFSGSWTGLGVGEACEDGAGRGGRISTTSAEDEDEAGAGDGLRSPVPGKRSL